jgi:predicted  nucleic acid-binding Zn-ribbon protein
MAEEKPANKAAKEAARATLVGLVKPEAKKEKAGAVAVKAPSEVQKAEAVKEERTQVKPDASEEVKAGAKPEAKAEAKKEADPSKEFVDAIMAEMALKGGSKKRLIKTLAEQYNFDKQKVLFRLRRALITERYAAAHAEGAGGAH